MILEINKLRISTLIIGVPRSDGNWDISWLGNQVGYLYGTSYPATIGNTVLTAHVWNQFNKPGSFYNLKEMEYGDQFSIIENGNYYVYEVRENILIEPNNNAIFNSSNYDVVTLLTC